jgi:hypothetical protein
MKFSPRTRGCSLWSRSRIIRFLWVTCALLAVWGCQSASSNEDTSFTAQFTRQSTYLGPDSIYWTFHSTSGVLAANPEQSSYSIPIQPSQAVDKDTLAMVWKTLSIVTYNVAIWAGPNVSAVELISKTTDSIATRLLGRLDTLCKATPVKYPWSHTAALSLYADVLFSGEARFAGYPGNCPTGIDTKVVDSLILLRVVNTKDSVGKLSQTWANMTWTADQVKDNFRRWLGNGFIRQGQYDTLYPFDDKPPTQVRPITFTDVVDTTAIVRGTDGVKVMGIFADDSGITGQSIQILSKTTGTDVTQKFAINATDFPSVPQKTWDLNGRLSIKTDHAPNGAYTLEISYKDRKNQILTARFPFYVYQPGGVAIDIIPPTITPILPVVRRDTVLDTVTIYRFRIGVNDINLKTVQLDGQTVTPVDGAVEKNVRLIEGTEAMVVIQASDSSNNTSIDTIRVYRRKAVFPIIGRLSPASGKDSVVDTMSTYSFRWKVDGVNIDSVLIDNVPLLLDDQRIAERVLPLTLGKVNSVRIRVVDKLKHVSTDSVQVFRAASIPPLVQRKGLADGVVIVPDSQSLFSVAWSISDNNLDQVLVQGKTAALAEGLVSATVYLVAGDTNRVPVWVSDKLGSITTDTVKVFRPDPRKSYLSDIASAQRGDSMVALSDFILPNIRFGRFEVTAGLYAKVTNTAPSASPGMPIVNVTVYDAMLFCNALSKAVGLDTFYVYTSRDPVSGYFKDSLLPDTTRRAGVLVTRLGYRLPTDSEWLVATTASQAGYPWGSSSDPKIVDQFAVWNATSPSIVGSKLPTGKGLFDLSGNAAEWVYKRAPIGPKTRWLTEGGDFSSLVTGLLTPNPSADPVLGTTMSDKIGFRIVRVGSI